MMKQQPLHPIPFQTFFFTNNTLVEQNVPPTIHRNKLLQLQSQFDKTASSNTKANFVEMVAYQLGLNEHIQPKLKVHLTNRGRIVKQAVESVATTLQQQQKASTANSIHTTSNSVRQTTNGSQLYKMRLDFICNP